jgi:UPF0271 protein
MGIDINCDVGEGVNNEHLLMPFISSCNIACGGHFGDKNSIDNSIEIAIKNNVLIGAHPSFPDKENFGRKVMIISDEELKDSIQNQLDLFLERLDFFDEKLHYIKPHGALYNLISVDENKAVLFMNIVKKYLKDSYLYVPYDSVIEKVALRNDVKIKYEVFADRNYNDDLTLLSRSNKKALKTDKLEVFNHVLEVVQTGKVNTISGLKKTIKADTFCVHGDNKNSIEIVKYLNENLKKEGFKIEI